MEAKFLRKVEKTEACWNWTGAKTSLGYGAVGHRGKVCYTHRIAYELWKGSIPKGLVVRHMCNNRKCVNPDHLEVGTMKDNVADMYAAGRQPNRKGEYHSQCKLTDADVAEIRQLCELGYRHRTIAEVYDVSQSHISSIHTRRCRM